MENRLLESFHIELEKATYILWQLYMIIERLQEHLRIKPYSKEDIMGNYCDIKMHLFGLSVIFETILDRMEKYGPKDKSLYDIIAHFNNEINKIYDAFVDAEFTYEKDVVKGAEEFYNVSIESLKIIKPIADYLARELNL